MWCTAPREATPERSWRLLTANNDIAPTFADIAGVEVPAFVDGRSLLDILGGGTAQPRSLMFTRWVNSEAAARGEDSRGVREYYAYRTATYKYVEYNNGERELYDLVNDPYELDNLAVLRPEIDLAPFSAYLEALKTCAGASCRAAEDAEPPPLP